MSREPSYFEHNGMPLHTSPNAGRVRQMQEPWLGLFTAHRAHPAEQRPSGTPGVVVMPEPGNEVTGMNDEVEGSVQLPAKEMPAAPSLLQRAATGTTGVPSTSVSQSTNQQQPQLTSAAQTNQPNAAVSSPMGQPSIPVNARYAEPADRKEIKSAGGPELEGANLSTGSDSLRSDFSDAVPLPPRVLVQKHLTIQTEISSMSTASGTGGTSLPGEPIMPLAVSVGSAISAAVEAGTEPGGTLTSSESFSASAVIPAAMPIAFARTPMGAGAGNIPIGNIQSAMPESQPRSDRSQRALLERLNDRASPQQQAGVGRRVHIGNLRITVQRPAMATTQTPSSAPSAQPQQAPAAAGQPLFNPWERHYMAFD
ncbi:MAG: hypothetical protein LAO76_21775 [Acidobacteriia bacterium]|nr:hypothetical protein [Terriglobia bacterium]